LTRIKRAVPRVQSNTGPQETAMKLRVLLLAAALSLWAMATYAADDITVYKDPT